MKKLLALLLLVSSFAFGGTVTGVITTATSGPVINGTLTLTPTQAFIVSGTATIVSSPVACYTDAFGNVVGEPNPLVAPVVTPNTGSGTLASGTYFTRFAYQDASGTTFYSFETTTVLSSTGSLIVTAPVKQPAGATGYKVFISTSSGTETLQGTVTGTPGTWANYTQSSALAAGAALPSTNTTACKLFFSDEGIPVAGYVAALTNSSGSNVSGFPQRWQLLGGSAGTVNLSNGTPLWNGFVQYPQAIVTTPAFNANQSILGGLNLNGFPLLGISNLGISGNETVSGTLNVTGAVTAGSYTNNLSAFAATTSAQLAGVLSDETGTGAAVFANTPTLVTPVLGVATATSIKTGQVIQPAATALTITDNQGGTRYSVPSGGVTQATINNTTLLAASSANTVTNLSACTFGASGAVTGTGAVANLFSCTIPGATFGAGKGIRVTVFFSHSTGTASVTYAMSYGGTATNSIISAGTGVLSMTFYIMNNPGVTNAQQFLAQFGVNGTAFVTGPFVVAYSKDSTVNQTLLWTFNVANTDQVTPQAMITEVIQ